MNRLRIFLKLIKFPIILLSTLSAAAGYFLVAPGFSPELALFLLSLLALAAGSAALNQVQDRKFDALMDRTRNRPLPSGSLSPAKGILISVLLLTAGAVSLYLNFGPVPFIAGSITVLFYNGIYTYLKRISSLAVIPGALIGALPPAIGWSAAGGDLRSPLLLGIMVFFYLWQIPHFWLLLGIHSEEYVEAGYPVITGILRKERFQTVIFIGICLSLAAGISLRVLGVFSNLILTGINAVLSLIVLFMSLPLLRKGPDPARNYRNAFRLINLFALSVVLTIILEKGVFK